MVVPNEIKFNPDLSTEIVLGGARKLRNSIIKLCEAVVHVVQQDQSGVPRTGSLWKTSERISIRQSLLRLLSVPLSLTSKLPTSPSSPARSKSRLERREEGKVCIDIAPLP